MTTKRLADDIARCHDAQCRVRMFCLRWLDRNNGGSRLVHAATLRPAWQCNDELCDHAITEGEIDDA